MKRNPKKRKSFAKYSNCNHCSTDPLRQSAPEKDIPSPIISDEILKYQKKMINKVNPSTHPSRQSAPERGIPSPPALLQILWLGSNSLSPGL